MGFPIQHNAEFDTCIIGGGINGAGIAREASMRGSAKVLLVEAEDLAGATSSASTKLIHGGLRYLEYYEFSLVREALAERKILLRIAPHIINPLLFVLPHDRHLRPAWLIRLGLFFYDHLASHGKLPGSHGVKFRPDKTYGAALKDKYTRGFTYSDCWADDARLVALNALDAKENGAEILTRTRAVKIVPGDGHWIITLQDKQGNERTITATRLFNAAGPWVRQLLDDNNLTTKETPTVRLVKGSHFIVKKLYDGDHAYILQQPDKRIIFAIPYQKEFTLVGTTDEDFKGDPRHVKISPDEANYLCSAINRSFKQQISPTDIIWSYSGVRPLFDDGRNNASSVTRDYHLQIEEFNDLPLLSVFGGKITTYRYLAAHAMLKFSHHWARKHHLHIRIRPSETGNFPLPGGDIPDGDFSAFLAAQARRYPWLPAEMRERMAHAYGTRIDRIIGGATQLADLGTLYADRLTQAEIRYLVENEFARTAEDILWRRTKLGLHFAPDDVTALERALAQS